MTIRVHAIQHVPFEGPAVLADLCAARGWTLAVTRSDLGQPLPSLDDVDLLVVLGGPMGVYDAADFPFLDAEAALLRAAVARGLPTLGICLGAQLLAHALGARVYPGPAKEVGWWPVSRVTADGLGALFPAVFTPLHWHGDTFDLPAGATLLASTDVVPHQAFAVGRAVGVQFHLEATAASTDAMVEHAASDLGPGGPWQQDATAVRAGVQVHTPDNRRLLEVLVDALLAGP